ncbi:site-specific integrase, partial [Clostridiaceae bacterium HSG29]|nr:site-specific integrase [Clostridiaceae bacterium HSG29]
CGLRNGEIMGLEWKDFDFNNNIFEVKRASQYISNEGIITKMPKNQTSIRKIHFNDSLKELLMEHKINNKELAETIPNWIETDRVFTTNKGGAIFPDTISKWFAKFLKRNNFSNKITFHGLRHTSATIMIYNEIDIQTIATRLGHADPTTTLKIYSHQIKKADKTAADKIFDTLK